MHIIQNPASLLEVPFYSQSWDLDNWEELGFKSKQDALYWQNSSCGIICLKMAVEALIMHKTDLISEMISKGEKLGAYSHKNGWSHQELARLAETYGLHAYSRESLTLQELKSFLDSGKLIIASVKWAFDSKKTWKERLLFWKKKGGHLALIVGYKNEMGFIVNHTSTLPDYNWEGRLIPFEKFSHGFTGRAVILST